MNNVITKLQLLNIQLARNNKFPETMALWHTLNGACPSKVLSGQQYWDICQQ